MKQNFNLKVVVSSVLICLCLLFTNSSYAAAFQFSSLDQANSLSLASISMGSGTESDPYIIGNISELQSIGNNLSAYYKLSNDIDLEGVTWNPIGTTKTPFTGKLDGNGYTISNFRVNSGNYRGLFGAIKDAVIKNLTLSDLYVRGVGYVGAISGNANGTTTTISNCHIENGTISGKNYVGGMIGQTGGTITISECSSNAKVTGTGVYTGGLLGYTYVAHINDSYVVGNINGNSYAAGIIANASTRSYITNSYVAAKISGKGNVSGISNGSVTLNSSCYDSEISGFTNSSVLDIEKLTTAMTSRENYTGWDMDRIWDIDEGETYPYLRSFGKNESVKASALSIEGKGTAENPYIITNEDQLDLVRHQLSAHYKLGNDINLNKKLWTPIGMTKPFSGCFDGNGYKIYNFRIHSTTSNTGFFARTKDASLINITLSNFWTNGVSYVGGLVGKTEGENSFVYNCHVQDGIVSGTSYVGGLIGTALNFISVEHSSSNIEVVATGNYSSSLIAQTTKSEVTDCYALGSLNGNGTVAGILGNSVNASDITNCYVAAEINGESTASIKGLYNGSARINNSYYDAEKSKVINKTITDMDRLTSAMVHGENYKNWDFNLTWQIDEGQSYPYFKDAEKPDSVNVDSLSIEGMGTEENPYIITNKEQFDLIIYHSSAWYRLANDIDVEGMELNPIGEEGTPFRGHFDGDNYTVSNFHIDNTVNKNTGFFGVINGASIMNIKLDNFQVTGADYVGGLVGNATGNNSNLNNCHLSAAVITGENYVGGIAGSYNGGMSNCTFSGIINATGNYCGGAAGYAPTGSIFTECKVVINTPDDTTKIAGIIGNNTPSGGNNTFTKIPGAGTKSNPYTIGSAEGLKFINDHPSANYTITGDINGGGTIITPIGTSSRPFKGYINGNGHTISNINVTSGGGSGGYGGIFGYVSGGGVSHITISKSVVDGGDSDYTGGLVGFSDGESIVFEDCHINDTVINANNYVGSLIGGSTGMVIMKDCSSNAEINAGGNYIGGLAGSCNVKMERCKFRGNINAKGDYVGGLAAYVNKGSFEESYSSSTLAGKNYVGGLIGAKGNSDVTILNCYATGTINGTSYLGGLVGYSIGATNATNAYAAMKIEGTSNIGGLESRNTNINATNCYYDNSICEFAKDTSSARPTSEMVTKSNFADWNFDGIWKIEEGVTYPYFDEMEYPSKSVNRNLSASGSLVGATTGNAIGGLTVNVRQGLDAKTGTIVNTLKSDQDGKFIIDRLGKGDYTLEIIGEGYITTYQNFTCVDGENNIGKIPVMPVMKNGTMSIVLRWGSKPKDLDSYLTGGSQDVYYKHKVEPGVTLDTDCREGSGPETVTIDFSTIKKGTYNYYVKWLGDQDISWKQSKAFVQVYMDGKLIKQYYPPDTLTDKKWNIFSIDTETKTIKDN